jgi:hypothetical protein
MASTLFSRTFLAASHRLITPSLPQKIFNPATFLSVSRYLIRDLFSISHSFDHSLASGFESVWIDFERLDCFYDLTVVLLGFRAFEMLNRL